MSMITVGGSNSDSIVTIHDWFACTDDQGSRIVAPEYQRARLRGAITNHEIFDDGEIVTTSTIKGRIGDLLLTASGRLYKMGTPLPAYLAQYPDAPKRLLESLPCVALAGTCRDCTCKLATRSLPAATAAA